MTSQFATAQDAQRAFYRAIERADLAEMMAVWAEQDDIVCIHPGGPRYKGVADIRESWKRIFSRGPELKFTLTEERNIPGRILSVNSVVERIAHVRGEFSPTLAIATNIFALSNHGWRLLVHHASAIPAAEIGDSPPAVLH